MKISLNKTFETRQDLDNYVKSTFGENADKNKEITIEADEDVLQKLSLSESTMVYGVKITKATKK